MATNTNIVHSSSNASQALVSQEGIDTFPKTPTADGNFTPVVVECYRSELAEVDDEAIFYAVGTRSVMSSTLDGYPQFHSVIMCWLVDSQRKIVR